MKALVLALVAISLIAPVNSAYAQARNPNGAPPAAPGGPNRLDPTCGGGSPIYAGRRADDELIAQSDYAAIYHVSECDLTSVWLYYGDTEVKATVAKNSKLKRYLNRQNVQVQDIIGIQNRRGELVVYVGNS